MKTMKEHFEFETIRKLAIVAMFSDDYLLSMMVLKGGNALSLVHKLSARTSLDIDFSIPDDFKDLGDVARRIESALKRTFERVNLDAFDVKLTPKPTEKPADAPDFWGGYMVEFKLLEKAVSASMADIQQRRVRAVPVAPGDKRTFTIDISKHEYCQSKEA